MALFFILVAGGFLGVEPAYAHASYVRSAPAADATLPAAPARLDIWFAQELFRRQGDNRIAVFGPDEQAVSVGAVQIDNDDRKHMWVSLPDQLLPGKYRVEWANLSSEDGDADQGSFSFAIDPNAPSEATAVVTAAPDARQTAVPTSTPFPTRTGAGGGNCLVGLLPAGGMVVGALVLTRRSRHK